MLYRYIFVLLTGVFQWVPVPADAVEESRQNDGPVRLCDRFASIDDIPERGVRKSYFGYIDVEQSLKPCLAAHEAEPGNTRAQVQLARIYFQQGKFSEGLALAQLSAKDQPVAYALLAHAYRKGVGGVGINLAESVRLLEHAVSQGVPDAMNDLSGHYAIGLGVSKDEQQAFNLLQQSADAGDLWGKYLLGTVYLVGRLGKKTDLEQAITLLHAAANGGLPVAQYRLSLLVTSLEKKVTPGASQYLLISKALFEKFSRQGSASASAYLGEMYRRGLGVPTDPQRAFELYRQAANHRHVSAMRYLGAAYVDGVGADKNIAEGTKWLQLAARLGSTAARRKLETLSPVDATAGDMDESITEEPIAQPRQTPTGPAPVVSSRDEKIDTGPGMASDQDPVKGGEDEVSGSLSNTLGGELIVDEAEQEIGRADDEPKEKITPVSEATEEPISFPEPEPVDPVTRFFSAIFQGEVVDSEEALDIDEPIEDAPSRTVAGPNPVIEAGEEEIDSITRFISAIFQGEVVDSEEALDIDEPIEDAPSPTVAGPNPVIEAREEEIDPITRFFRRILEGEGDGIVEIEE